MFGALTGVSWPIVQAWRGKGWGQLVLRVQGGEAGYLPSRVISIYLWFPPGMGITTPALYIKRKSDS